MNYNPFRIGMVLILGANVLAAAFFSFSAEGASPLVWHLLRPPVREDVSEEALRRKFSFLRNLTKRMFRELAPTVMPDLNAPFRTWGLEGSYDSVAECDNAQLRLIRYHRSREKERRLKNPGDLSALPTILASASKCIAANDIRLIR